MTERLQEVGRYDYMEVIGRAKQDARAESNAGTTTWMWEVEYCLEQISSSYRGIKSLRLFYSLF